MVQLLGHAQGRSQASFDAAHSGCRDRADIRPYFVVVDRLDIITGNPAGHDFLWPQRHHRGTLGLWRRGSQPGCEYLLERSVTPVVRYDQEEFVFADVSQMSAVDAPAQHVCHGGGPLVLVGPGRSPASCYPAVFVCLTAGKPVSGCAGVGKFFGLLADGSQARGEDHVQERSLGDSLHDDASKIRKRVTLWGLPSKTLQVSKIALSERQALAGLDWFVEAVTRILVLWHHHYLDRHSTRTYIVHRRW